MESGKRPVVIIVGAGTSGFTTAACLTRLSIPYVLLEREDCVASLWDKKSYDRLHLHLPKQFCELPYMPFPSSYPKYVSKKDFLKYLHDYVTHFNIEPLCQRSVVSAAYDENVGKWNVTAKALDSGETEVFSGEYLVVATGENSEAFVPEVEGLSKFMGDVIHSTEYKCGDKYKGMHVLVVGSGNSGMEIAFDLATYGAKTSIAVRSPIHVISRGMMHLAMVMMKYLPFYMVEWLTVLLSKLRYGYLSNFGIQRPREGPFTTKAKFGKYPVLDVGTSTKIRSGEIQVFPGLRSLTEKEAIFENGKSHPFDCIIFATGFTRSTKWLKGDNYLLNENGLPKHRIPNHWKGENGLFCVGLAGLGFYRSALDAQNIANEINTVMKLYDR